MVGLYFGSNENNLYNKMPSFEQMHKQTFLMVCGLAQLQLQSTLPFEKGFYLLGLQIAISV